MECRYTTNERLALLGELLTYPTREFASPQLARELSKHGGASVDLQRFAEEAEALQRAELEELYSRTFDLAPMVAPYLSVHLWGDESFQRAQLMTGLRAAYARVGVDSGGELPDHVGVVLTLGTQLPEDEWRDLATFAVLPAVRLMRDALLECRTPYRHLVAAAFAEVADSIGVSLEDASAFPAPTQRPPGDGRPSCSIAPPGARAPSGTTDPRDDVAHLRASQEAGHA